MQNEKVKPEDLTHSARSPVIPVVKETEKALKAKEKVDKAAKNVQEKAEDLVKGELGVPEKTAPLEKKLKPEKTKKDKEPKKDAALTFPVAIRINDYGFIGMRKGLLEALGWHKGLTLKLEKNEDGSVTVRKA